MPVKVKCCCGSTEKQFKINVGSFMADCCLEAGYSRGGGKPEQQEAPVVEEATVVEEAPEEKESVVKKVFKKKSTSKKKAASKKK